MGGKVQRIPGKIAQEVGAEIVSGRLKPGALLADEITASGRRRVSRSAYREAIHILAAKGLVQSRPKLGTRVSPLADWHLLDPDVLAWMFSGEPQQGLLVNLFELRKMIEPEVAALAAERRSLKQLNEMGQALEVMARETLHSQEGRDADEAFHAKLIEACGNPFLASLSATVTTTVIWSTIFKYRMEGLKRDSMPEHLKVHEAIAARDSAGARAAMVELIDLALGDITQAMGPRRKRRK
ncbi:MAG: FadR family transcriptional regulator [Alphaproteobacteria bacterium]|nr:FadR family transcriptional regulator [Alphaproteobacteria bacterium]